MTVSRDGLADAGVLEATENGRLPWEIRRRIEARARWLHLSLWMVIALWFCYLLAVPILWKRYGPLALALVPSVGIYLFTWLGYYRHELWHRYFPRVDNPRLFNFVSYLLFADPQVFRSAHASHHSGIHTPRDWEFFCAQWTTNRAGRRRQFLAELALGNIAWELSCLWRLWRTKGAAVVTAGVVAKVKCAALLALVIVACRLLEPGSQGLCLAAYGLTIWAGSLMTRHNQWIEHLDIVADGSLAERNLLTRNLSSESWAGRLVNFMNHHEAREHVYHHTEPGVNSRGAAGLALPRGAQTVSLTEYWRVLLRYHRSL
jgi:hypothetical protein